MIAGRDEEAAHRIREIIDARIGSADMRVRACPVHGTASSRRSQRDTSGDNEI